MTPNPLLLWSGRQHRARATVIAARHRTTRYAAVSPINHLPQTILTYDHTRT